MTVVVINVVKVGIQKYKKRRWMKYYGLDKLPESKFGVKVEKEQEKELKVEDVVFPETKVPKVSFQKSFKKMMKKKMREVEKLANATAEAA